MRRKNIDKKRKSEFNRVTKKLEKKLILREQANKELDILINILSKEIRSEKEVWEEILSLLEADQKELNYFGYRGVLVGIVAVIFTSFFTTYVLPTIIDASEVLNNLEFNFKMVIIVVALTILVIILLLLWSGVLWQLMTVFFSKEKMIRDQIYINEYLIKVIQRKIDASNKKI